jgi:parallel beta-helix repeat protein
MQLFVCCVCAGLFAAADPPTVTLTKDDTEITQSCRIEIPAGTVIEDANNDGVLHVKAANVTIEFAPGAVLRGAPADTPPDKYAGSAIRIEKQPGVTIRGARISGYKCAVWATAADGLTLDTVDASDNRRARLRSDPEMEAGEDWMFPHNNDDNEWLQNYGAAFYVEDAARVVVHDCRVRHGQNGLCLDRVNDAQVYDNDFSFNSGWGIALWRSNRNTITRNACDFCIRGYSHMVYNRGQDSAGILMFEQCSDNVIAENSVTHGGDGLFGYAGHEATWQRDRGAASQPASQPKRAGCNNNLLLRNDFSYAAAHGIEMTFSFGNRYIENRLVGNAICGIWNGYSQETLIARNEIADNGEMGYGLERGGINIDSSRQNAILENMFRGNRCGVHLWWGDSTRYRGWHEAHLPDWEGNVIASNTFTGDVLGLHFRGSGKVVLDRNAFKEVRREAEIDPNTQIVRESVRVRVPVSDAKILGKKQPVGARPQFRGRENIIMAEWGPWDHESPLIRRIADEGGARTYAVCNLPGTKVDLQGTGVTGAFESLKGPDQGQAYVIRAAAPGVHAFEVAITGGEYQFKDKGLLVNTTWEVVEFPWTHEPTTDLEAWRAEARGPAAQTSTVTRLKLNRVPDPLALVTAARNEPLAPASQPATRPAQPRATTQPATAISPAATQPGRLPNTRPRVPMGVIARTRLPLPAGTWQFNVVSSGGVRLLADGKALVDQWRSQGRPRRHSAKLELAEPREVELVVEQFRERQSMNLSVEISRGDQ